MSWPEPNDRQTQEFFCIHVVDVMARTVPESRLRFSDVGDGVGIGWGSRSLRCEEKSRSGHKPGAVSVDLQSLRKTRMLKR
jgi:hypothetical protein